MKAWLAIELANHQVSASRLPGGSCPLLMAPPNMLSSVNVSMLPRKSIKMRRELNKQTGLAVPHEQQEVWCLCGGMVLRSGHRRQPTANVIIAKHLVAVLEILCLVVHPLYQEIHFEAHSYT